LGRPWGEREMSHATTSDIKILPRAQHSPFTGSPFDATDILSIKASHTEYAMYIPHKTIKLARLLGTVCG
jgi:hypothetical protein